MRQACAVERESAAGLAATPISPVAAVRAVLERPDAELDYAKAKLAFDRIIDPSLDAEATLAELTRLVKKARRLIGPAPSDGAKLSAVRKLIYESGPWNDWWPFEYDHPRWKDLQLKLLHNYLANRRGNCVSMPSLFLILAERLGLNVALAQSPEHFFVRYTAPGGRFMNIETTNGGHPTRDIWYRQVSPMTDLALKNGLYLRSLSKREAVAALASAVVEHLSDQGRLEEVIAVSKVVLDHFPRDVTMLLWQGNAYGRLLERFQQEHRNPWLVPPRVRAQAVTFMERNMALFAQAERLGWVASPDRDGSLP